MGLHTASKLHLRPLKSSFCGQDLGITFYMSSGDVDVYTLAMELTGSIDLSFLPVFNFRFGLWRVSVHMRVR